MAENRIYIVLPVEKRRAKPGEATRYFEETVLAYKGDDCLVWPFAHKPNGYAHFWLDGRSSYVHREVCRRVYGEPRGDRKFAAHECGHGHLWCVTQAHLTWKTPEENSEDMIRHGTRLYGEQLAATKLTEANVREIKARHAESRPALAREFGVSNACIHLILNGINWAWV